VKLDFSKVGWHTPWLLHDEMISLRVGRAASKSNAKMTPVFFIDEFDSRGFNGSLQLDGSPLAGESAAKSSPRAFRITLLSGSAP
jgi:hypothetical protein